MGWRVGLGIGTLSIAWLVGVPSARGQVVERDSKLTGPKGRTIERSIRTERGPGFVDRQVEIKRPGETLSRETRIVAPPHGGRPHPGPGPGFGPGPRPGGGFGPPRVVERDVIVERGPGFGGFVAPFLSFSFNSAPPPPAVIYPEPVYVQPPVVIAQPPIVYEPPPVVVAQPPLVYEQPAPVVVAPPVPALPPQVQDALGRLSSLHYPSRRDGCLTLGHLGDDRAVDPLIARLEHDLVKDVRVAAAWSLGEIGDPRAALALEKASLYDKRHEVRDAASIAYRKLPKPGPSGEPGPASPVAPMSASRRVSSPGSIVVDPGPAGPGVEVVPPPPTPLPDESH